MKLSAKWLVPLVIVLLILLAVPLLLCRVNRYQDTGSLNLPGLQKPVTVMRDEKGMAYIKAENMPDALMAMGFVTAQDRLFQMELTKLFSEGRIGELVGVKAEILDARMRALGFHRQAAKQAQMLNQDTRNHFQKYLDGVNAFIQDHQDSHPLEFKLAGIKPTNWEIADSLAVYFYMSWNSSANMQTEIITQMLVDKLGPEKAAEIFPLNINPDDNPAGQPGRPGSEAGLARIGLTADPEIMAFLDNGPLRVGSNNWAAAPKMSPRGKPIVANDPHLDARILPGPWYPCGLILPDIHIVGVSVPGIPGIVAGRNDFVAFGVTNAYGDSQDLYVETVDPANPDNYLEGDQSYPFEVITETLRFKDKQAPQGYSEKQIETRLTHRGPVISELMPELVTDKVISLRWAPYETMGPALGLDQVMLARSADDIFKSLEDVNTILLNVVFADVSGNIGWTATGKLPIRSQGQGTVPYVVRDGQDNWTGWIPTPDRPGNKNPDRGWLGTCNHMTVSADYPYYYSSHLSPSYRYRRLTELMDQPGPKTTDDHWRFQRDNLNLMARTIAPIMTEIMLKHDDTREMGDILKAWNFQDDPQAAAPTIFQDIYRNFAMQVLEDELGRELAMTLLDDWYFWQERMQLMVTEQDSPWFDDLRTPNARETMADLFHRAALETKARLGSMMGPDPKQWLWGRLHTQTFVSPIRREGFGKSLLGGGPYPARGSGETLCRAIYDYKDPFQVTVSASLRMVADLADRDKVLAVLPGGVTARVFNRHTTDQLPAFMNGDQVYWWFSDQAINEHCQNTLTLAP
jgi:penicillin amidase